MALLPPVAKELIGLEFGPTTVSYEPPAYGQDSVKANFHDEPNFNYYAHFHTARDYAAPEGTIIVASETGKVVYSGWDSTGGGEKLAVQIRPGTIYANNHCEKLLVPLGASVKRGQAIATIGNTGAAHGFHTHFWLQIDEVVSGVLQHNLWNPRLFMPGGSMANDPRILPETSYVVVNGDGIQMRDYPYNGKVFCHSDDGSHGQMQGIYRNSDNLRITYELYRMPFKGWYKGDFALGSNLWAEVTLPKMPTLAAGFRTNRLFVKKELIHFA